MLPSRLAASGAGTAQKLRPGTSSGDISSKVKLLAAMQEKSGAKQQEAQMKLMEQLARQKELQHQMSGVVLENTSMEMHIQLDKERANTIRLALAAAQHQMDDARDNWSRSSEIVQKLSASMAASQQRAQSIAGLKLKVQLECDRVATMVSRLRESASEVVNTRFMMQADRGGLVLELVTLVSQRNSLSEAKAALPAALHQGVLLQERIAAECVRITSAEARLQTVTGVHDLAVLESSHALDALSHLISSERDREKQLTGESRMTLEGIRAASKGELLASQHLTAVQAQALTTATLLTEKNVEVNDAEAALASSEKDLAATREQNRMSSEQLAVLQEGVTSSQATIAQLNSLQASLETDAALLSERIASEAVVFTDRSGVLEEEQARFKELCNDVHRCAQRVAEAQADAQNKRARVDLLHANLMAAKASHLERLQKVEVDAAAAAHEKAVLVALLEEHKVALLVAEGIANDTAPTAAQLAKDRLTDGLAAVGVTVFAEELALRAKFDANLASLTSAHLRLMDDLQGRHAASLEAEKACLEKDLTALQAACTAHAQAQAEAYARAQQVQAEATARAEQAEAAARAEQAQALLEGSKQSSTVAVSARDVVPKSGRPQPGPEKWTEALALKRGGQQARGMAGKPGPQRTFGGADGGSVGAAAVLKRPGGKEPIQPVKPVKPLKDAYANPFGRKPVEAGTMLPPAMVPRVPAAKPPPVRAMQQFSRAAVPKRPPTPSAVSSQADWLEDDEFDF